MTPKVPTPGSSKVEVEELPRKSIREHEERKWGKQQVRMRWEMWG
jgi:hypothetical protein